MVVMLCFLALCVRPRLGVGHIDRHIVCAYIVSVRRGVSAPLFYLAVCVALSCCWARFVTGPRFGGGGVMVCVHSFGVATCCAA